MTLTETLLIGSLGGLVYNVLPLISIIDMKPELRPDFKNIYYWVPYIVRPFLGFMIVFLISDSSIQMTRLLSFYLGLTAPTLIEQMINTKTDIVTNGIKIDRNNQ